MNPTDLLIIEIAVIVLIYCVQWIYYHWIEIGGKSLQ